MKTRTHIYEFPLVQIYLDYTPLLPNSVQLLKIGDLHANVFKIIQPILSYAILTPRGSTTTEQQMHFNELVQCYFDVYDHPTDLRLLRKFNHLLRSFFPNNTTASAFQILLMGDTIADRHANDFLIFSAYELLDQRNVQTKILASNHDAFFLFYFFNLIKMVEGKAIRADDIKLIAKYNTTKQYQSFLNWLDVFNQLTDEERRDHIQQIETHYLPKLVLISYEYDSINKEITINTHAPYGVISLNRLLTFLLTFLSEKTICIDITKLGLQEFTGYIDTINTAFLNDPSLFINTMNNPSSNNPLFRLIWQRFPKDNQPATEIPIPESDFLNAKLADGTKVKFSCGHDRQSKKFPGQALSQTLDSPSGRLPPSREEECIQKFTEKEYQFYHLAQGLIDTKSINHFPFREKKSLTQLSMHALTQLSMHALTPLNSPVSPVSTKTADENETEQLSIINKKM